MSSSSGQSGFGPPEWVEELVSPGRRLWDAGGGILSAFGPDERGSHYDRGAAVYDRVVGNRFYNRAVWSCSSGSYTAFAATAVADHDGPLIDVGCGSAVFTAAAYGRAERRLVLVDRSMGMLTRAARRLGPRSGRVAFVQADLFDLPFVAGTFPTVACFGMLHLFDYLAATVTVLGELAGQGGSCFATSLVAETATARRVLALLRRTGEAAAPRSEVELTAVTRSVLGDARVSREGAMVFVTASSR